MANEKQDLIDRGRLLRDPYFQEGRYPESNLLRMAIMEQPAVDVGDAIEKQKPQKPIYVDTRFRNHGKHISDGVSLSKCYKCPNCNSHIFHVFDSEKYCDRCGQALDWGIDDG